MHCHNTFYFPQILIHSITFLDGQFHPHLKDILAPKEVQIENDAIKLIDGIITTSSF